MLRAFKLHTGPMISISKGGFAFAYTGTNPVSVSALAIMHQPYDGT
jgi:hypothetical protein